MTPTVTDIRRWQPSFLRTAAEGLRAIARGVESQRANIESEQNVLAESWHGDAAIAAAERIVSETSILAALADALNSVGAECEATVEVLDWARSNVFEIVDDLIDRGFEVGEDGVVTADRMTASLRAMAGPMAEDAVLAIQIETQKATIASVTALRQANEAAIDVCDGLRLRIVSVQECSTRAASGSLVASGDSGFSWQPDVSALVAGATIGGMSDATAHGLQTAAAASADDVALGIGRRIGPLGAALGTVPAISNDIADGMDPTKAIVTEAAGGIAGVAAAGLLGPIASAAVTGTAIGSVVPGAGTAAGLVVGVVVGAFAAYAVPKLGQRLWD